jgi:hypothetical protein
MIYMHYVDDDGGREKIFEPIDTMYHVMVRPLSLTRILMEYAKYSHTTDLTKKSCYMPLGFCKTPIVFSKNKGSRCLCP